MNNREITITEMPYGCELHDQKTYSGKTFKHIHGVVIIRSKEDAEAIIESLQRMIKAEQENKNPEFI